MFPTCRAILIVGLLAVVSVPANAAEVPPAPTAASPLAAPSSWSERSLIIERLAPDYGEAPKAVGVTNDGAVLELFKSDTDESWTLVVTLLNGFSRVLAEGGAWVALPGLTKQAAW